MLNLLPGHVQRAARFAEVIGPFYNARVQHVQRRDAVRMIGSITLFSLAIGVTLCACNQPGDPPVRPLWGFDAGGSTSLPPPTVVTLDGALPAPRVPDGGVVDPADARSQEVGAFPDAASSPDAAAPPDAARDGGVDASALPCNLIAQDCPSQAQACYPVRGGNTQCVARGELGAMAYCPLGGQHTTCDRGLVCEPAQPGSMAQCLALCSDAKPCLGQQPCIALAGYNGIGYCSF